MEDNGGPSFDRTENGVTGAVHGDGGLAIVVLLPPEGDRDCVSGGTFEGEKRLLDIILKETNISHAE